MTHVFRIRQDRLRVAINAIALIGTTGHVILHGDRASGTAHFIVDVKGYFQ